MKRGAIAVLDALGFKGIWRGKTPEQQAAVFQRLANVRDGAVHSVARYAQAFQVRAFSDSLIISSSSSHSEASPSGLDAFMSVASMASVCATIFTTAVLGDPPLLYRGAIAYGDFDDREDFWMGPAIDEAAANERLAEAAVVWFCPSADAAYRQHIVALERHLPAHPDLRVEFEAVRRPLFVLKDYDVPLKGGSVYRTEVANPINHGDERGRTLSLRILGAFGDSMDLGIQIKKQNTARFLRAARSHAQHCESIAGVDTLGRPVAAAPAADD